METKIKMLERYLFSKIDKSDLLQVEKANRYISFVKRLQELNKDVDKTGATVIVKNGSQEYVKSHPALGEISKVNKALLDIERSFGFTGEKDASRTLKSLM